MDDIKLALLGNKEADKRLTDAGMLLECKWINTNKEVEQMCKCSKCGYPISYFWSRTPFCPNCGAPMTDEAVDMVLKRLEVPKDDQT